MTQRPRKIRLLHVIRPGTGGAARYLTMLLQHLDRERFEPTVIASSVESATFPDELRALGAAVHVVDMERSPDLETDLQALRRVIVIIRQGNFDVIHTHASKAGFLGRVAARAAGRPASVYTPHGFYFQYNLPARVRGFYTRVERALGNLADVILCTSRTEAESARAHRIAPLSRIVSVPNAVDVEALPAHVDRRALSESLGLPTAVRTVVMVGRLTPPKDPGTLLRAARHVLKAHPRTRFIFVGDGEMLAWCRDLARELDVADKVILTGYRPDAAQVAAMATVSVLSSYAEGLPLALLESMALSRPVVASDIPGCREVIEHGKTGILFPVGDERALSSAIVKLFDDKPAAEKMGANAHDYILTHHDARKWIREIEKVYLCAVAKAARRKSSR